MAVGDGLEPKRWWYTDDHQQPDEVCESCTPVEVGLAFDIYEGRRRRHVGRQIGFTAEWRNEMPKVGNKHFPYTKAGKAAAAKAKKAVANKLKRAK